MKKFSFSVFTAMLFMVLLAFQANAAGPKAVVPKADHNFGVVRDEGKVTSDYTVINEGDAPLEIERVATS